MAGRSVVIRPTSPTPGAPLGEVGTLGAESGVLAVAGIEPRGVGESVEGDDVSLWSTPRVPEDVARRVHRFAQRHRHEEDR
jgi:hypothetical protein